MSNRRTNATAAATTADLLVFALLVAVSVAGRICQPAANFTPVAAASLFAGAYFSRRWVAPLVPASAMGVTNLVLPSYEPGVMIAVYAMLAAPALIGPWLRRKSAPSVLAWWARVAAAAAGPSAAFFVVTNFAVWGFGDLYPKTAAGLVASYTAGLPFYRTMLAGDVVYTGVLFAGAAWLGVGFTKPAAERCDTPAGVMTQPT